MVCFWDVQKNWEGGEKAIDRTFHKHVKPTRKMGEPTDLTRGMLEEGRKIVAIKSTSGRKPTTRPLSNPAN